MHHAADRNPDVNVSPSRDSTVRNGIPGSERSVSSTATGADIPDQVAQREQDMILDASLDSFPASDPPSWTGTHAGPPRLRG